jgi:hypothetical protein
MARSKATFLKSSRRSDGNLGVIVWSTCSAANLNTTKSVFYQQFRSCTRKVEQNFSFSQGFFKVAVARFSGFRSDFPGFCRGILIVCRIACENSDVRPDDLFDHKDRGTGQRRISCSPSDKSYFAAPLPRLLLHHFLRILIFPDPEKDRLSETVIPCPFRKLNLANHLWLEPTATLHFRSTQILVPTFRPAAGRLKKGHLSTRISSSSEKRLRKSLSVKPVPTLPANLSFAPS